jgi:hypothetical protein
MKKLIFSLLILSLTFSLFAQNGYNTTTGARGLAMGEANIGFQNIDAAFSNQAGLAHLTSFGAVVTGERRFALSELSTLAAAAAYPTIAGTFAFHVQYYGFQDYNEQKLGIAYGRKLGKKFSAGAQISYLRTQIPLYGNSGLPVAEIGIQAEIARNLLVSTHLVSPFRAEITEGENLPTILRIGLTWQASDKVLLTAQADKDIDFDARFRSGLDYKVSEIFQLRVGIATNPTQVGVGFGLIMKNGLALDVASGYNQLLGFMPGVGLKYSLNEKKE